MFLPLSMILISNVETGTCLLLLSLWSSINKMNITGTKSDELNGFNFGNK